MKIAQLSQIVLLSVLAMGCTSDEEDELLEVVYSEEEFPDGIVNASSKYRFILSDDHKLNIHLEGEIGEIKISGIGNYVTIEDDKYIEKLTIQGDTNIVDEGILDVTIESIIIAGNENMIIITACGEWSSTSDTNFALGADDCDTNQP